jgi:myo-inositol-1(or 4)-monophosphatase
METDQDPSTAACDPAWIRDLALRAGEFLERAARRRDQLRVDHKGRVDLVTEIDLEVQQFLVEEIRASCASDGIGAEEGDLAASVDRRGPVWYLDPLDGTTNFVHGYPFYCVSIARWVEDRPESAVVWAPALDELYCAVRGHGSRLERPGRGEAARPLRARERTRLEDALLATGFPYHRGRTAALNLAICARALTRVRGLRRGGSAALDLCHVADSRLDGYWEMALSPWDLAAAVLVAREAGVRVTDFLGREEVLRSRRVAAARPGLHDQLLELITATHEDPDHPVLGELTGPLPLDGPLPGDAP